MSKTNKIRRLEKDNAQKDLIIEMKDEKIISQAKRIYELERERDAFIEDLEMLKALHTTPIFHKDQAY